MNELEKKYEETRSKRMRVENELELLANNETVKRYFALSKMEDELFREESQIFQKIRFNEFENCEHLFVDTIESNEHNRFCACVKCGLDSTTLREDKSWLTPNRLASYNYIKEHLHTETQFNNRVSYCITKQELDNLNIDYEKIVDEYVTNSEKVQEEKRKNDVIVAFLK